MHVEIERTTAGLLTGLITENTNFFARRPTRNRSRTKATAYTIHNSLSISVNT